MRKSLTRAEILRNKADIAELFAKQSKFSRFSKASKASKASKTPKASALPVAVHAESPQSRAVSDMANRPAARTQHSLEESEKQESVSLHCQVDGLKLFLLLKRREQGSEQLQAPKASEAPRAQSQNLEQMVFISPAKSLGNAVQRNRAKRLQREFYRHNKQKLQALALKIAQKKWNSVAEFFSCCSCCYWGFVIHRSAFQAPKEQNKPSVKNKDFTESKTLEFRAELSRYQSLIAKLEQSIGQTDKAS